jgi:hypothetical protein
MSDWGQGVVNNTIEWGRGSTNNSIGWGSVYADSPSGDTALENAGFTNTYSMSFDGVSTYVDCGVLSSLNSLTEASISLWVYLDDSAANYVVSQWEGVGGSGDNRQFALLIKPSDNRIDVYFGSSVTYRSTAIPLNTGQWYNIIATYNASNSPNAEKTLVYVNGTKYIQTVGYNSPSSLKSSPSTSWQIGKRGGYSYEVTEGEIDEVAIFNKELSQSEVTAIASAPSDLTGHSGITNWWRMGDIAGGSGSTINDQVGSNNGTLINTPTYSTNVPT